MSYGADFAQADPANAPLNPPLFIGADPFIWGAILLALAAALLLGWYLGARSGSGRGDAAQSIWREIYDAARSAMAANDDALRGRAKHLRKVTRERLGRTLTLTGGMSKEFETLENAIDGRGPAHSAEGHGHGPAHGSGHDDGHVPDHRRNEPSGGGGGAATANITIVTGAADASHGGGHGPGHDAHGTRDLSHREQTDALRLAVARFAEHWRDEPARVRELRGAHAELSDPGQARPARPAISGTRAH